MRRPRATVLAVALSLDLFSVARVAAQAPLRKIGEMEVALVGVHATLDPVNPVVPKNTASGVRVVVQAGDHELAAADVAALFGAGFRVEGLLSGQGLPTSIDLPHLGPGDALPAD